MSDYEKKLQEYAEEHGLSVSEKRGEYYFFTQKRKAWYNLFDYKFKVPNVKEDGGVIQFARRIFYAATMEGRLLGYDEGFQDGFRRGMKIARESERLRIEKIMKSCVNDLLVVDQPTEIHHTGQVNEMEKSDEVL